jgi:hypothetical protein
MFGWLFSKPKVVQLEPPEPPLVKRPIESEDKRKAEVALMEVLAVKIRCNLSLVEPIKSTLDEDFIQGHLGLRKDDTVLIVRDSTPVTIDTVIECPLTFDPSNETFSWMLDEVYVPIVTKYFADRLAEERTGNIIVYDVKVEGFTGGYSLCLIYGTATIKNEKEKSEQTRSKAKKV